MLTRRNFLTAAACAAVMPEAKADALGQPLGLALYTVRDALARDFMGTLQEVSRIGYRKVEAYMELNGRDTATLRQNFDSLGLVWDDAHCTNAQFTVSLDKTIELAKAARLRSLITAMPLIPNSQKAVAAGLPLDTWKRNADLFNTIGEKLRNAGMVFGYHNHNPDFRPTDGTTGYDTLLKFTDPELVKLELDVGWAVAGGVDPADYLTRYAGRFITLHLKDLTRDGIPNYEFKMTGRPAGLGTIDWRRLLAAARNAGVKGFYVEQEGPYETSSLEAARANFEYLTKLN